MIETSKDRVLEFARCDLSFALGNPEMLETKLGRERLEHCIEMITQELGDHEEFEKLKKRWADEELRPDAEDVD